MSLNFACIGIGGYIASRHLNAIKKQKIILLFHMIKVLKYQI